jgi:hypothetical protein
MFTNFDEAHDYANENFTETFAADAAAGKFNLCQVWLKVRPVVRFLSHLPFVPKKWKDAANLLFDALDANCAIS